MKNIFISGGLGQDGQILSKIILSKKKYRIFILGKKKGILLKSKIKAHSLNTKMEYLLQKKFVVYLMIT